MEGIINMKSVKKCAVVIAIALLVAACSSDSKSNTAAGSGSGAGTGKTFTVAYSQPIGQNPYLKTIEDAMRIAVEKRSGKFVSSDARGDVNKQVSDIDSFITQKVDAIVYYPLLSSAVEPSLQRAASAGIKLVALGHDTNYKDASPPPSPISAQVMEDRFNVSKKHVDFLAKTLNGTGNVVYLAFGIPAATTETMFASFKENLASVPGLKLLERVDNKTDDAAGARPLIDSMITKYGDSINAIVVYNEPSTIGAFSAIDAAGKKSSILLVGNQLTPEGVSHIQNGDWAVTWDLDPVTTGVSLGTMAMDILEGKPESQWHKTVITPSIEYTKTNIGDYVPWDQQLAKLSK
jgi:ABC-type sugar transport system substrate-binding protein